MDQNKKILEIVGEIGRLQSALKLVSGKPIELLYTGENGVLYSLFSVPPILESVVDAQ